MTESKSLPLVRVYAENADDIDLSDVARAIESAGYNVIDIEAEDYSTLGRF